MNRIKNKNKERKYKNSKGNFHNKSLYNEKKPLKQECKSRERKDKRAKKINYNQ